MRVINNGHKYSLDCFDGDYFQQLQFMKRVGENYPGNFDSHPGTNIQEVLRALINRFLYLDRQKPHYINGLCINLLRNCLFLLEFRAKQQRGEIFLISDWQNIETLDTCPICGHIECSHHTKERSHFE